jgi:hypothetical protein
MFANHTEQQHTHIHLASNQPEISSCVHNLVHSSTHKLVFVQFSDQSSLLFVWLDSVLPSNTHVHLSNN